MSRTRAWILATVTALSFAGAASAADAPSHQGMQGMEGMKGHEGMRMPAAPPKAQASEALTAGEVRKVDPEQGKVTIKHDAIANLDMPAMTMVFRAAKPELLAGLKPGDRIRFRAESADGAISVTRVEKPN